MTNYAIAEGEIELNWWWAQCAASDMKLMTSSSDWWNLHTINNSKLIKFVCSAWRRSLSTTTLGCLLFWFYFDRQLSQLQIASILASNLRLLSQTATSQRAVALPRSARWLLFSFSIIIEVAGRREHLEKIETREQEENLYWWSHNEAGNMSLQPGNISTTAAYCRMIISSRIAPGRPEADLRYDLRLLYFRFCSLLAWLYLSEEKAAQETGDQRRNKEKPWNGQS